MAKSPGKSGPPGIQPPLAPGHPARSSCLCHCPAASPGRGQREPCCRHRRHPRTALWINYPGPTLALCPCSRRCSQDDIEAWKSPQSRDHKAPLSARKLPVPYTGGGGDGLRLRPLERKRGREGVSSRSTLSPGRLEEGREKGQSARQRPGDVPQTTGGRSGWGWCPGQSAWGPHFPHDIGHFSAGQPRGGLVMEKLGLCCPDMSIRSAP